MKKYNILAYIILILIILLSGFFIYKVVAKNENEENEIKNKTVSEIKLIEGKFLELFNDMNNIKFDNYKITIKETENSENNKKSTEGAKEKENNDSEKQSEEESSENKSESSEEKSSKENEKNKEFNLEEAGILVDNQQQIDWKKVKNNVEDMYSVLYSMTLDLYQISIAQEDIINFNKEYDNLTKAVKEENKEQTLQELVILYGYIPGFIEKCADEEKEKILIKTKNEIFKAYSILEKEEWNIISENIKLATREFTKLVTNINEEELKDQYDINKTYVMINEIQNAIDLKDKEIFLIKYKNIIEQLENL